MRLKIYQVDAFAEEVFSGNPAAVCPLLHWLPDELMLKIAAENNLAETAFYVPYNDHIELRWFTPTVEVDLCGHATLATAYVLFEQEGFVGDRIDFYSPRSGQLSVTKNADYYRLDFPADSLESIPLSEQLLNCFDIKAKAAFKGKSDILLVFEDEKDIQHLKPDFHKIAQIEARGIIVTAPGHEVDFVSRFFGPRVGVNEDPVTGSAHTSLIPYWAEQLNKQEMQAKQLSFRGGFLKTKILQDRVEISGKAKLYMVGEIYLD